MNYHKDMNTTIMDFARWDWAVNRRFYRKLALVLGVIMLVPVIFNFVLDCIQFGRNVDADTITPWEVMILVYGLPISMGYMFHNLITRQGRINELTLPAKNSTRFCWHLLRCSVGFLLTYVVFLLLSDGLNALLDAIAFGTDSVQSVTALVANAFFSGSQVGIPTFDYFLLTAFSWLAVVAFISTFPLGNALKYKFNVLLTFLFHFVFIIAFSIGLGFLMAALGKNPTMLEDFDHLLRDGGIRYVFVLIILAEIAFIAFCWWQSYRLYCKASIVSRRNK